MSKPGLLLAAVAILATSPMPVSAADLGNGGSASVSQPAITRSGPPRIIWFFDGRDDTRDFPTNGFFPGDFAADPFGAAIGAAGLFGSTLQLLKEALPDKRWSCVQFARANYKRMASPHFGEVIGIASQDDRYSPFNPRSSILRYWHLIEATLEPPLPSVRSFTRVDGVARSSLEIDGWSELIAPEPDEIFAGVLDYIGALRPADTTVRVMADVEIAFRRLHRAIVWPTRNDAGWLDFPPRSMDFGKDGHVPVIVRDGGLLQAMRRSEWREGAIAEIASPLLRPLLLAAVEAAFAARWLHYRLIRSGGGP